ncbi:MAG: M1 family aminopeptidase, partial [Candidatus Brocadiia bacterium]
SGIPVDYVASLPAPLKAALQGFFRPIQTTDLLEYNFASFFYPMPPCVRNRAWTWETELTVPPGFSAVANGRFTAKRPASESADAPWIWTYVGDRPEMACEIIVGKFDIVDDPGVDFTVHHFFETGVVKDTAEPVKFARDCYSYYATTFGGDFYRDPIVVHLRPRPMISHCISYAVLYTRERAVLAHEMAHLWWGSTVKQNPIESSMWYEGLAEYSVMMYSRTRFGPVEFLKQLSMSNARWRRADQGPYSFRDIRQWSPDRALGYVKGVALFRGLETVLGPEKFGEFLRKLAAKKDEFPDVQQIREICVGLVPTCDWYFRNGFMGLGSFDMEARNAVKIGPGKWEVTIRSVGMSEWRAPVTIVVRNASGQIAATTVTIPREGKIVAEINVEVEEFDILVDPFEDIPDANLSNNVIAVRPK